MVALTSNELMQALAGRRPEREAHVVATCGLRFALYGRMSTRGFQDPQASRAWQRDVADGLVDGVGRIVVEFFDTGRSRRWSWWERPQAAALLTAAARPDREFDAVVVGEYERAFHGNQFSAVVARLNALGVQVWLPETGGPVDLANPVHQATMVVLGAHAEREVVRARHRVLAAMRARVQGRFLGGRPPYGYRLADGGPHPIVEHARWGRRLQVLEPNPVTAPWVRWMFAQRAGGCSVASLARELNERGVPCPSGADRERNPHRSGERWIGRTVAVILENPRYTGRQVWNRQGTVGRGVGGRGGGRGSGVARWNPVGEWEVSDRIVHEPLVDDAVFVAVQRVRVARPTKDGAVRRYALAGVVVCGVCGRRLDAHWVHGRPGYRCRHGYTSATLRPPGTPGIVYVREDHLRDALPGLLDAYGGVVGAAHCSTQMDAVDRLRMCGLEIVCGEQDRALRPTTITRQDDVSSSQTDQQSLPLG